MMVKKFYDGFTLFAWSLQTKRQRLLKDPVVIELILGAFVAAQQGEKPETYIKSLTR